MRKPLLVAIVGPTAVGKTAAAVAIAKQFATSILSFDSRQCYQELDIGVAAPTVDEMQGVEHWFIKSHSIHNTVNAASFEQYGLNALDTIFQHKPIAVAVGGTGLYLQALLQGLDAMPQVPEEVKVTVAQGYAQGGLYWLQQEVKRIDSKYFAEVDTQNPVRLLRALEICYATQQPFSSFRSKQPVERPFNTVLLGLDLPRQVLYERINQRVYAMMQQGLLQEVDAVRPHQHLNALQTVGYTELFAHLRGEVSLASAIGKIQQHSRNYAKRQLTWFKRMPQVQWFEPQQLPAMIDIVRQAM